MIGLGYPNYLLNGCSNKIEVSYQEAVALKRQEELIREEEAAWLAESEQKAKRGVSEKEKKSKKKQVWHTSNQYCQGISDILKLITLMLLHFLVVLITNWAFTYLSVRD